MRSYYWHYAKPYTLVQGSQQEITANLNTNIESNDEQACTHILPTPDFFEGLVAILFILVIKSEGVMTLRALLGRAPNGDFSSKTLIQGPIWFGW